jgi:outer membrane protein with beta-barrel domain
MLTRNLPGARNSCLGCCSATMSILVALWLPSSARAQSSPEFNPRFELSVSAGAAGAMGDESFEGWGPGGGADIRVHLWRRVSVGAGTNYSRTRRDFSSDTHWSRNATHVVGVLSLSFRQGQRTQPFFELGWGIARVQSSSRHPTYTQIPGPPGLIKGPDEVIESRETKSGGSGGIGVRTFVGQSWSVMPELRFFGIGDRYNPVMIFRPSIRIGYGWGTVKPGPVSSTAVIGDRR